MTSRYNKTKIIKNEYPEYSEMFESRGVQRIEHLGPNILKYPTDKEIGAMNIVSLPWKIGDTMWRYASMYYNGRSDLWWVIAHFNKKPTDQHFYIGDIIHIPTPLDTVLRSYGL